MNSTSQDKRKASRFRGIRGRLPSVKSVYDLGFSRPDDRFIPLAADDLIELVSTDTGVFGPDAQDIRSVADQIMLVIDQEKAAFERLTAKSYRPFNPDRETLDLKNLSAAGPALEAALTQKLHHMLEKANFEKLTGEQVDAAVQASNTRGMRVRLDPEQVSDLSIWVRGSSETEGRQRSFLHPVRGIVTRVAIFNRLAFVASLKNEGKVHLRLFKDIPIRDVEALLPHASVRLGRRDALMLIGGGGGAVWSVVTKLTVASVAAVSQLLWVIAVPLAGLSWRIFSGYRRAVKTRNSNRAQHLYHQILGSNLSAVHMLAGMISEEEIKEAVLLYAFCTQDASAELKSTSFSDLDGHIQKYLHERLSVRVDFDIDDAVETLDRLDLWQDRTTMRVVDPAVACERLERHWKEQRTRHYHAGLLGIKR